MSRLAHLFRRLLNGTLSQYLRDRQTDVRRRRRRERWQAMWTRHIRTEFSVHSGVHIHLYPNSKLCELIYCDDFEHGERQFLDAFLAPGDMFVDVGANLGLYSVIAAKLVGNSGRVYAFEPCQASFARLQENVALNGFTNVECFRLALSDTIAPLAMTISRDGFDAWNSAGHPTAGNSFGEEMVTSITWDEFAGEHDLIGKVAMMKIDVEGWESRVLRGGTYCLTRDDAPVVQVEFTDAAALSTGTSCTDLYRTLETFGYQMFRYDARERRLRPDPLRPAYPYQNLFAIKRADCVADRLASRSWLPWSRRRLR